MTIGRSFRFGRLGLSTAVLMGASLVALPTPAALGAGTNCAIKNLTHAGNFTTLQSAVDAATSGDTIQVKGWCLGSTTIGKDLSIVGKTTATSGRARLDADHLGRVLTIGDVTVSLNGLLIHHGLAAGSDYPEGAGGAIFNQGALTLTNVEVRTSEAVLGGGIYTSGQLTLDGTTAVHNNEGSNSGGGIMVQFDAAARLTMKGHSSVHHNHSPWAGGVMVDIGTKATITESASIHHNTADNGGGLVVWAAKVTVSGNAVIRNNTASEGGGIYTRGSGPTLVPRLVLKGNSVVRDNVATSAAAAIRAEGAFTMDGFAVVRGHDSSIIEGSGIIELVGYDTPGTFTMKASSRIKDNAAGVDGAAVAVTQACIAPVTLTGVTKPRTPGNTPKRILIRPFGPC